MTSRDYWCRIAVAAACLLTTGRAVGQYYGVVSCTEQEVQPKMRFYDALGHTHVVAVEYRNTSGKPCSLTSFKIENNEATTYRTATLQPGDVVNSSFRWSTEGASCHRLTALEFLTPPLPNPLQFVGAPVLLPEACSPLQQTDFVPGEFVPDWKAENAAADPPLPSAPVLATDKQTYYMYEPVKLHVKLSDRPATDTTCPYLIESVRDPRGNTRLMEVVNPANKNGCHPTLPGIQPPWTGPPNEFEFRTGGTFSWGVTGLGEETYTMYQLSDPTALGERRLVASNSVTVNVVRSPVVCLPKDLEPTLHFYDAPENMEAVALNYRNTSSATCLLKPVGNRPGIVEPPPIFPLNAGDTAHSSLRFRKDSGPCQYLKILHFW